MSERLRRILIKLVCLILLIVAANFAARGIADAISFEIRPSNEELIHRTLMVSAVLYALLIAVPFVPGAEIGISLIALLGPPIVFLVYLSTLAGLSISYVIGRLIPLAGLIGLFDELRFYRAAKLLKIIEVMSAKERLAYLVSRAPNRVIPFLLRHRYVALAIVINLPGNIIIGGGGGIALMAGISRLYSVPGFLFTIALAVAPIPLAVLIFGTKIVAG